jgi:hypothetical protein
MGNWIYENRLSVEVMEYCISSCANYIFPAGEKKYLHKNSLLVWHGGAYQKEFDEDALSNRLTDEYFRKKGIEDGKIDDIRKKSLANFSDDRKAERALYKTLNIDNSLPTYGQSEGCSLVRSYGRFEGYYYALKDLNKMGIKNIVLLDKHWEPQANVFSSENIYRVQPIKGKECNIEANDPPKVLYGFVTFSSGDMLIKATTSAGIDKIFQAEEHSTMDRIFFDEKSQSLIFVNRLTAYYNSKNQLFVNEEKRLHSKCKTNPIDRLLFDEFKFQSYISRYIFNDRKVRDILVTKHQCDNN